MYKNLEEAIPSEKGIRYNNEKILNNKIQYSIRYVKFVKPSFFISFIIFGSAILVRYCPA